MSKQSILSVRFAAKQLHLPLPHGAENAHVLIPPLFFKHMAAAVVQVLIISPFYYCHYITTLLTFAFIAPLIHQPHCCQNELWNYRSEKVGSTQGRTYGSEQSQRCCLWVLSGCSPFEAIWSCLSELPEQTPFETKFHF